MSRLTEELYTYIKTFDEPISLGQICNDPVFVREDRKDLSSALRVLGSQNLVYRSIKNGKAYYSCDSNKGEAMNPTKAFIADSASALNGIVNRGNNANDILLGTKDMPAVDLLNQLDNVLNQMRNIVGEESLDKGDEPIFISDLSFDKRQVVNGEGYSICIPDGFKIVQGREAIEAYGENRDFMAYLPNSIDENLSGDADNAFIRICPGMSFPFQSIDIEEFKIYYSKTYDHFFRAEQSQILVNANAMYKDGYVINTGNSIGLCLYMDSSTPNHLGGFHFFYINVPIRDKFRMFRIDICDMVAENSMSAKRLARQILMQLYTEKKLVPFIRLDDDQFTSEELDRKKTDEWKKDLEDQIINCKIMQHLAVNRIQNEITGDIKFGNISSDQAAIQRELRRRVEEFHQEELLVLEEIFEQIEGFFIKMENREEESEYLYELQDLSNEYLKSWKQLSTDIGNGEKVTSEISNYKKTYDAINGAILLRRQKREEALKKQRELEKKYQRALDLLSLKDYRKTREAIVLLEEMRGQKDVAELIDSARESLSFFDESQTYPYIAETIKKKLREDLKNSIPVSASDSKTEEETDHYIELKKQSIDDSKNKYRLVLDSCFASIQDLKSKEHSDEALDTLLGNYKESIIALKHDTESVLEDIYARFMEVEKKEDGAVSLKKLISFYESVYGNGGPIVYEVDDNVLYNYELAYSCKYNLDKMKELIREDRDYFARIEDVKNAEWKKIGEHADSLNKDLQNLKTDIKDLEKKIKDLQLQINVLENNLLSQKGSLDKYRQNILNTSQMQIRKRKEELEALKQKRIDLSEKTRIAEENLAKTFALNYARKKELNQKIEDLQKEAEDVLTRISITEDKIVELDRDCEEQLENLQKQTCDLEESLKQKRAEFDSLRLNIQEDEAKMPEIEAELSVLEEIRSKFDSLYYIVKYGERYGYGDIARKLKNKYDFASFMKDGIKTNTDNH